MQLDLIGIYRTPHLKTSVNPLFSIAYGTVTKQYVFTLHTPCKEQNFQSHEEAKFKRCSARIPLWVSEKQHSGLYGVTGGAEEKSHFGLFFDIESVRVVCFCYRGQFQKSRCREGACHHTIMSERLSEASSQTVWEVTGKRCGRHRWPCSQNFFPPWSSKPLSF